MRHTLCPRCDNLLSRSGYCTICGYQVRNTCSHCGHLNIPTAKYCGGCGRGTTTSIKYRVMFNKLLNPFQQIKLKRFLAGIAFGTLLGLFAFSSMGMKYAHEPDPNKVVSIPTMIDEAVMKSDILMKVNADIDDFCLDRDVKKNATNGELNAIMDIMIKDLNFVALRTNKTKKPFETSLEYAEQQHCTETGKEVTRGSSAMMFFAYVSDLLELKYKDYTKGSKYNDIPRFHMMDVPTAALKEHDIKLAKSDDHFAPNEPVQLSVLCDAAKQVAVLAAQRANIMAPDLVAPPEIIIE